MIDPEMAQQVPRAAAGRRIPCDAAAARQALCERSPEAGGRRAGGAAMGSATIGTIRAHPRALPARPAPAKHPKPTIVCRDDVPDQVRDDDGVDEIEARNDPSSSFVAPVVRQARDERPDGPAGAREQSSAAREDACAPGSRVRGNDAAEKRAERHNEWNRQKRTGFLVELAACRNVSQAARAGRLGREPQIRPVAARECEALLERIETDSHDWCEGETLLCAPSWFQALDAADPGAARGAGGGGGDATQGEGEGGGAEGGAEA